MALHWSVENVTNYKNVCFDNWDEEKDSGKLKTSTEQLIFITMIIGISKITENNWKSVYSRIKFTEHLFGKYVTDPETQQSVYTEEFIKSHIGMWTNASRLTPHKFKENQIKRWEQEHYKF